MPVASFSFPTEGVFVKRDATGEGYADNTVAVFFNPGQPFEVDHPAAVADHCWFVNLPGAFFADAWAAFGAEEDFRRGRAFPVPAAPLAPKAWVEIAGHGQTLCEAASDDLTRSETIFNLLGLILPAALAGNGRAAERPSGLSAKIRAARLDLHANFRERITLEDFSERVGLSPFHLCRVFREETGFTIHRTLTRLRLRQSLEDLKDQARNITDVAFDLGFSSHSHFTAAFVKAFGLTPSAFRARLA